MTDVTVRNARVSLFMLMLYRSKTKCVLDSAFIPSSLRMSITKVKVLVLMFLSNVGLVDNIALDNERFCRTSKTYVFFETILLSTRNIGFDKC